jgi:probable phosphoglycerate mutase
LLLWRHGETEWNASRRVQGQLDVDLSDVGRAQAVAVAPRLAAVRPDLIVASDLRRAATTAAALAELTGLDVALDARLRERDFGEWQGRHLTEIATRWPAEYAQWRAGEPISGLGLEDLDDMTKRVAGALAEIIERVDGGTAVVATHGGSARQGTAALLDWPASAARTLGPLSNCHWSELTFDTTRGWQLFSHNVG